MPPAPIEYMKWPNKVPIPTYDEIVDMCLECMKAQNEKPTLDVSHKRTVTVTVARQLICACCKYLRRMSTVEVAEAMGLRSHSLFTDRAQGDFPVVMEANAGVAMVNEVVYCLLRDKLNHVAAERRKCGPPPSDYKAITRKALRNHAGGAV